MMRIRIKMTALLLAVMMIAQSLNFVGGGSVSAAEIIDPVIAGDDQSSSPIKANSLYGTTVRGGSHADKQATTGSTTIAKELIETKWAGDMSFSRRGHMEFDMSASSNIDWNNVQSIKLTMFLKEHTGNDKTDTIQVFRTEKPSISEENWTWNNTLGLMDNAVAIGEQTFTDANTGTWVEIDVTDLKESLQADATSPFALALYPKAKADNGGIRFYSQHQESGKYKPYLSIYQSEYVDTISPTVKVIGLTDGQQLIEEDLTFTIEALDNVDANPAILLTVNGVPVTAANGSNTIRLKSGQNMITIAAMDAAGNVSETKQYTVNYSKSQVIPVTGDTYTDIRELNKNFNGAKMQLKEPVGGGTTRNIYLSFALPSNVPYVKEAGIELFLAELMGNERTSEVINIYEVSGFDETTLTSGNAPAIGEKVADAAYSRVSANAYPNRFVRLDISEFINKKLAAQQSGLVYFVLKIDNGHDQKGAYFLSKENSQAEAPRLVLVEGLPAPTLEVVGIEDQAIYSTESIKDVAISAKSVNDTIQVDLEVIVNDDLVAPNINGQYDVPLQLGTNTIKVTASDEAGNTVVKMYTVTRLQGAATGVYYVDSEAGDDNNDGLSEQTAWKSLEKLNAIQWQPGSKILFKRGGIWNGQFRPKGSGTVEAPIIVDVYGESTSRPIINGGGISNKDTNNAFAEGAVHLYNLSYWEINGIEVTNKGAIVSEAARAGIMVVAGGNGFVDHVHVKDVYVHDINSHDDAQKISGGIIFRGDTVDEKGNITNVSSGFRDILVENSHIKDVAIEGLRTKTYKNGSDTGSIKNVDVVFRNNLIENILGDGIVISEMASGGLVEKNIIRRHSMSPKSRNYAGLWLYQTDKVLIQNNEVYDGVHGYNDGEAFDFDISATNNIYQYNYSHNNRGGFLLTMASAGVGNVFRYNISKNDGNGTEIFFCMNDRTAIYNNTIYIGEGMKVLYLIKENNIQNMFFKNNIVHVEGKLEKYSQMTTSYDAPNVSNNLFYPASVASLPGSPNSYSTLVTGPANLVSPDAESIVMDTWTQQIWDTNIANFKLTADSPAIDAGVVIPNSGAHDIYGTPLYAGQPDIGAHEFTVVQVDRTALNDLINTAQSTHDAALEGTNAGQYPVGSKAVLQDAIHSAADVAKDTDATQLQINEAVATLNTALETFKSAVSIGVPGDVNGNDKVSIENLAHIAKHYGKKFGDADWNDVKFADINNDNKIDIEDLVALAKLIS
ncbi:MAG: DNRLRE domain-containing protein [Candidatus Pristimantibacillus lignocellulolyticus]|uniref:Probable pectate lyase C n=1 Tax=Candidatus Pristimantibacillus lignocellulolyticus TaxID=2994561 RepID=A0A9J6ZDL6_9BACL|nr:MAG: DNRLRE domain-containing protein [Candidatus Pristimantibacillus lignocellulolyticus]